MSKSVAIAAVAAMMAGSAAATTYFQETFSDKSWDSRWVVSDWKQNDGTAGAWKVTAGDFFGDAEAEKGKTNECVNFACFDFWLAKFSAMSIVCQAGAIFRIISQLQPNEHA